VAPDVSSSPVGRVVPALDRLDRGDVRYRFVIDISTFSSLA
jgi:uncharacterized zinc-type alcohol dehydrogenase-like protein